MGEIMVLNPKECSLEEDSSSTDTEDYLDLADLNDFQECSSLLQWQDDKVKMIQKLIASGYDATSYREACLGRGGLLNGIEWLKLCKTAL